MTTQRPNLFRYAYKELSQDAMICWLLDWANERYAEECPALHKAGQRFARALFDRHDRPGPESIRSVSLEQQSSGIDVCAYVNDQYVVLIEDKTDANPDENQLKKYHEHILANEVHRDSLFPILIKTGSMPLHTKRWIENLLFDPPWRVFERGDFLRILGEFRHTSSDILKSFLAHLEEIEEQFNLYRVIPPIKWPSEWWWSGWHGLYRYLEDELEVVGWGHVNNASGGFLGLTWHWRGNVYLQIEQEKLCFKVEVGDKERRSERRWYWHERVVEAGKASSLTITKPPRFGNGWYMTVAILDGDWRQAGTDGKLDLAATLAVLRQAEEVLDAAVKAAA